jgi:hypothetical protein
MVLIQFLIQTHQRAAAGAVAERKQIFQVPQLPAEMVVRAEVPQMVLEQHQAAQEFQAKVMMAVLILTSRSLLMLALAAAEVPRVLA